MDGLTAFSKIAESEGKRIEEIHEKNSLFIRTKLLGLTNYALTEANKHKDTDKNTASYWYGVATGCRVAVRTIEGEN